MPENITELVDEPELIEAADDISLDRWTKYGHDRLYINGGRVEPYIDLADGTLGDTGAVRVDAEFDGDVLTVEIGREDGHSRHDVVVISLSGDTEVCDGPDKSQDAVECGNEASDADRGAEPTAEHADEVGYHKAAGQAQQIAAQRLFDKSPELTVDGGFDFECPYCGADASSSSEKPYCSVDCAESAVNRREAET